jgi:hypothetical protein
MKKPLDYKRSLTLVSFIAIFFVILSSYLFVRNQDAKGVVTTQPIELDLKPTSSTKLDLSYLEMPVDNGSCVFIDQQYTHTQNMMKKNDAKSLGYAVELDASMATETLVTVCKIDGKDIQLMKDSPNSEPESNWTLAIKDQSATSSWKFVRFRDTLQSDFPGCEVRHLYKQDDGRFVTIKCSQRTELGMVGTWEDYFLADMEKKTVKKYTACASNDLNLVFNIPSQRDRFPLEDHIPSMRCSKASDAFVKSE